MPDTNAPAYPVSAFAHLHPHSRALVQRAGETPLSWHGRLARVSRGDFVLARGGIEGVAVGDDTRGVNGAGFLTGEPPVPLCVAAEPQYGARASRPLTTPAALAAETHERARRPRSILAAAASLGAAFRPAFAFLHALILLLATAFATLAAATAHAQETTLFGTRVGTTPAGNPQIPDSFFVGNFWAFGNVLTIKRNISTGDFVVSHPAHAGNDSVGKVTSSGDLHVQDWDDGRLFYRLLDKNSLQEVWPDRIGPTFPRLAEAANAPVQTPIKATPLRAEFNKLQAERVAAYKTAMEYPSRQDVTRIQALRENYIKQNGADTEFLQTLDTYIKAAGRYERLPVEQPQRTDSLYSWKSSLYEICKGRKLTIDNTLARLKSNFNPRYEALQKRAFSTGEYDLAKEIRAEMESATTTARTVVENPKTTTTPYPDSFIGKWKGDSRHTNWIEIKKDGGKIIMVRGWDDARLVCKYLGNGRITANDWKFKLQSPNELVEVNNTIGKIWNREGASAATQTPAQTTVSSSPVASARGGVAVAPKNPTQTTVSNSQKSAARAVFAAPKEPFPDDKVSDYLRKYQDFYLSENTTLEKQIKPIYKASILSAVESIRKLTNDPNRLAALDRYILPVFNETRGAKSKYIMTDYRLCDPIHDKNKKLASKLTSLLASIARYNKAVDALLIQHMKPFISSPSTLDANYIFCARVIEGENISNASVHRSRILTIKGTNFKDLSKTPGGYPLHGPVSRHISCFKTHRYLENTSGWFIDGMGNLVEVRWRDCCFYADQNSIHIFLREGQF